MAKVRKAVIAAAGFGTRFLPQTKAMPKEMLPIVDKPVIQYIVEDLVAAGIKDIIIVGSSTKRAIEDHFDVPSQDMVTNLLAGGESKKHYIDELDSIANMANFVYIRQKGPYGNATPLANVSHLIGDEPFIYSFADDLIVAKPNYFQQMIAQYEELQSSILSCMRVTDDDDYKKYGILGGQKVRDDLIKMESIIEKPGKDKAPSDFYHVSAFLFTPDVLPYIDEGLRNLPENTEYYVSDGIIQPMLQDGKTFFGYSVKNSKRYDTGNKLEYLKTVVDFALKRDDINGEFMDYLKQVLKR
jgi:UTP--glucose-1-phosphate uridylyltransferase